MDESYDNTVAVIESGFLTSKDGVVIDSVVYRIGKISKVKCSYAEEIYIYSTSQDIVDLYSIQLFNELTGQQATIVLPSGGAKIIVGY